MQENKINREIVESARVFGQWLNQIAISYEVENIKANLTGIKRINKDM